VVLLKSYFGNQNQTVTAPTLRFPHGAVQIINRFGFAGEIKNHKRARWSRVSAQINFVGVNQRAVFLQKRRFRVFSSAIFCITSSGSHSCKGQTAPDCPRKRVW